MQSQTSHPQEQHEEFEEFTSSLDLLAHLCSVLLVLWQRGVRGAED